MFFVCFVFFLLDVLLSDFFFCQVIVFLFDVFLQMISYVELGFRKVGVFVFGNVVEGFLDFVVFQIEFIMLFVIVFLNDNDVGVCYMVLIGFVYFVDEIVEEFIFFNEVIMIGLVKNFQVVIVEIQDQFFVKKNIEIICFVCGVFDVMFDVFEFDFMK